MNSNRYSSNKIELKQFRRHLRNKSTSAVRDKYFEANGYKVIRFENRFVFQDPEFVIDTIKKYFIS
jgi:very-short-patch-repair endonuclease